MGIVVLLAGCHSTTPVETLPDSGSAIDSGSVVDAGTEFDSGQAIDAGSVYGIFGCPGVLACVEDAGFENVDIDGCDRTGTSPAASAFASLAFCAESCSAVADAGACVRSLISDGGSCSTQWIACENVGESCGKILSCFDSAAADRGSQRFENCILIGTAKAIELGQAVLTCVNGVCANISGPACLESATADGGTCATQAAACEADMSGNDGG